MKLYYVGLLLLLFSCKEKSHDIEKLRWIEGVWEMASEEGVFIERWERTADTLMKGAGYFITRGNDTGFRETLSIENRNDTPYYIAIVVHNGNVPVKFRGISISNKEVVFENPAHDFPQQIIYTRLNDENMVAMVSGRQQGKTRMEEFRLRRTD